MGANYQIRVVRDNGDPGRQLPDVINFQSASTINDFAGILLDYPRLGKWAEFLEPQAEFIRLVNGKEPLNGRFMLQDWRDELVKEGRSVRIRQWSGVTLLARFAEARIDPAPGSPLAMDRQFTELATFGAHLKLFIDEAQDRDALWEIDYDFNAVHDSNGEPWEDLIAPRVKCGTLILDFMRTYGDKAGYADFCMKKRTLQAFLPGTMGTDRTIGDKRVTLQRGRDLIDGPVHTIAGRMHNDTLVIGDGDRFRIVRSEDGVARMGGVREASYVARGVTKPATLIKLGNEDLRLNDSARRNRSYGVVTGIGRDPEDVYGLGDTVFIRDGGLRTMPDAERVRGIITVWSRSGGMTTAAIDVNNRLAEADIRMMQRMDEASAATDGIDGGARPNPDSLPPKAPNWVTGDALTSETYDPPDGGGRRARAVAQWHEVTEDVDGVDCGDLAGYRVMWRYADQSAWGSLEVGPGDDGVIPTSGTLEDLVPGRTIYVYIVAFDDNGNTSPANDIRTEVLPTDRGSWIMYDGSGGVMFSTFDGATRISTDFLMGDVPGVTDVPGASAADATGPGFRGRPQGFQFFDLSGSISIELNATTGDLDVNGNATIQGFVSVGGDVDIGGSVHVHGTVDVDGTGSGNSVTIHGNVSISGSVTLGGSLTLAGNIDADGHSITGGIFTAGVYKTVANGIVIDGNSIDFGATSLALSTDGLTVGGRFAATGDIAGGDDLNLVGQANVGSLFVLGNTSLAALGSNLGFYGSGGTGRPAITGSRGGNVALADLLASLDAQGLVNDSTTA